MWNCITFTKVHYNHTLHFHIILFQELYIFFSNKRVKMSYLKFLFVLCFAIRDDRAHPPHFTKKSLQVFKYRYKSSNIPRYLYCWTKYIYNFSQLITFDLSPLVHFCHFEHHKCKQSKSFWSFSRESESSTRRLLGMLISSIRSSTPQC